MRKALFKCFGTGKCVYLEEMTRGRIRMVVGYVRENVPDKVIIERIENNGQERAIKSNFEYHYDQYNKSLMRCLLHVTSRTTD